MEHFWFLIIKCDASCRKFVYIFYQVEEILLYSEFTESSFFNHEWVLYFVKLVFCIYWYDVIRKTTLEKTNFVSLICCLDIL